MTGAAGLYWHLTHWEMRTLSGPGGTLPGARRDYVKVPLVALLVLAPLMGAVYAMFLPFIGFALLVAVLGRRLGATLYATGVGVVARILTPWRPGEAHLADRTPNFRPPSPE